MHPLTWILQGKDKYKDFLESIDTEAPSVSELRYGLWVAVALVALRVFYNRSLLSTAESWAVGSGPEHRKKAQKLLEEVWVTVGGTAFRLWTLGPRGVFAWLAIPACATVHPLYYNAELGWYIHLLLKHRLGYGTRDGGDMRFHHLASLALLLLSFAYNGMHIGTYVLALLNLSNPILHLAKIANEQGWPMMRKAAFACFALVFFVSRVVIYPLTILHLGWFQSRKVLPAVYDELWVPYVTFNLLLLLLYLLQLQWMYGIIRVLARALSQDFEAAGKLADIVDPTTRQLRWSQQNRQK